MQLLAQAREQLPPEACPLQGQHTTSSSSSQLSPSPSPQPQPQQQLHDEGAWRLCLAQVQHNLLLTLQLIRDWRHHNAHCCLSSVLLMDRCVVWGCALASTASTTATYTPRVATEAT